MALVQRKARRLMPGENPELSDFGSARRWLTIYEQRQLLFARDRNLPAAEADAIAEGVAFWGAKVAELSGLEIDFEQRLLNVGPDGAIKLTRRELQLLEFLAQHPGHYFTDDTLAVRAWGDRLSGDQVRIYVRRLRQKLAGAGWELVSKRGQGYSLVRSAAAGYIPTGNGQKSKTFGVIARANALLARQRRQLELAAAAAETLRSTLRLSEEIRQRR